MKKFEQNQNTITINNRFICSLEEFKLLEPTYQSIPPGYTNLVYIPGVKHIVSSSFGSMPMTKDLIWSDGDRYISRIGEYHLLRNHLLKDDIELENYINEHSNKNIPYNVKRQQEYPTIEELVIAMWENQVEGKPDKMNELQKKRIEIKNKYPKG